MASTVLGPRAHCHPVAGSLCGVIHRPPWDPALWAGGGCAARGSRLFLAGGGGERAAARKLASLFFSLPNYPAGPILLFLTGSHQPQTPCPGNRSSRGSCDRSRDEPGAAGRFPWTDSPGAPKMDEGDDAVWLSHLPSLPLAELHGHGRGCARPLPARMSGLARLGPGTHRLTWPWPP